MQLLRMAVVGAVLFVGFTGHAQANGFAQSLSSAANGAGPITGLTRTHLVGDVYEYKATLRLGAGLYDTIGLHRVVREQSAWNPKKSSRAAFLVHGSASNFTTAFLPTEVASSLPADQALAIHLAQGGVDVWGIDLRWTFVPDTETDFSFMQSWNTAFHVKDIAIAATVARATRLLTGHGASKLFFLGHSSGAHLVYAYANADTQRPALLRDVRGIIPVEVANRFAPDTDEAALAFARYEALKAQYDAGVFFDASSLGVKTFAGLALAAPNDPSPLVPGFTNEQAVLLLVSATYAVSVPPYTPWYHFLAGTFDELGLPTGLLFADYDSVLSIAVSIPGFQSLADLVEGEGLMSGLVDLPYDDHLGSFTAPTFYVGSAGGFGDAALYTLGLLGSTDKTSLVVQLLPPGLEFVDWGHADVLWSADAEALAWDPIRSWILSH